MASAFDEKCWAVCRRVPRGAVTTYGAIAEALGSPGAARAVGGAMSRNPDAPVTPCHRIVAATGVLTGYSGGDGVATKAAMLRAEGVPLRGDRIDMRRAHVLDSGALEESAAPSV